MASINDLLLEADVETQTQYQISQAFSGLSIINKLLMEDQPLIDHTHFQIDVSDVMEGFPKLSFKKVHQKNTQNQQLRKTFRESESERLDLVEIRRELAMLSNRYSLLCMENIKLRQQSNSKTKNIQYLERMRTSTQEQVLRLLEENKKLIEEKESMIKQYDEKAKSLKPDQDIDRLIICYSKSISHLVQQNDKLKSQIKEVSNVLTKKIIRVSQLQNKLDDRSRNKSENLNPTEIHPSALFLKDLNRIRSNAPDIFKKHFYPNYSETKDTNTSKTSTDSQNLNHDFANTSRTDRSSFI